MAYATETYVVKGMRQDDSDLLFNGAKEGLSFAFENLNMRFMADKSTTALVATQEKGNTLMDKFYITDEFFIDAPDIQTLHHIDRLPFRTIGVCTVDKYLVVFGKCLEDYATDFVAGNDVIIRFEKSATGDDVFIGWVLYNGTELDFRTDMPLETLGNVETDICKKVYFVDGVHGPRAVNVVNPDAGQIGNINLGFELALNDELDVTRNNSVAGGFPMGKVRFFYTYFNDEYSETAIVDWSPFFDCAQENQGGSPDSNMTTQYAFNFKIENADTQFKFVRVYFQHFTSNDAAVYTLKYIERPLNHNTIFSTIVKFDGEDVKEATETYLDMKVTGYTFIPYTLAEKDNRMFYGNIKKSMPDLSGVNLKDTANIVFDKKYIGEENLNVDVTYKYKSDMTTFAGSNYSYMGFRKSNWYRFGLVAQYKTGEWSDVLFIKDEQCDMSSGTEIEYSNDMFTPVAEGPTGATTEIKGAKPVKSRYYVPKAILQPVGNEFFDAIQQLKDLGFKRVKPVCVVPPPGYRNVITQGISCATNYVGGDRKSLKSTSRYAIPSWFFRPIPLFPQKMDILFDEYPYAVKPHYPYTLRKIDDLTNVYNIHIGGTKTGNWKLNPKFDDDRYMTFNILYREYRHGFSLPPKDRINAEFQSSDMSVHDYFYMWDGEVSSLFSKNDLDLFYALEQHDIANIPFHKFYDVDEYDNDNWYFQIINQYNTLPWHSHKITGYDNTVFVDETICTLNSPEVDYDFDRQVGPWYTDKDIEIVGYAQVTGAMTNTNITDTPFSQDKEQATDIISNDSDYKVVGKSLFNIFRDNPDALNNETKKFIDGMRRSAGMPNMPFVPTCGPWWLDTMLVNAFKRANSSNTLTDLQSWLRIAWWILNPAGSAIQDWLDFLGTHESEKLFGMGIGEKFDSIIYDNDNGDYTWRFRDDDLYNVGNTYLDPSNDSYWFIRGIDFIFNEPSYKLTTTFYGETNKGLVNERIISRSNAVYPYSNGKKKIAVFNEFNHGDDYSVGFSNNDAEGMAADVGKWASIPMSWNTVKLTYTNPNDTYWLDWINNRQSLGSVFGDFDINSGIEQQLPFDDISDQTIILDPKKAVVYGDFRGLFSYYFFPYGRTSSNLAWYKKVNPKPNTSEYIRVTHPILLPRAVTPWIDDSRNWNRGENADVVQDILAASSYHKVGLLLNDYLMHGSQFGAHYYAPGSTNFVGGYFEPYYAHVVYPFMSNETNIPFCGSSNPYTQGVVEDVRPANNSTNSCLYSSCTNYVGDPILAGGTYSAYYHASRLTQELRPEPSLKMPFVDSDSTGINYLYSYNLSDAADNPNIPLIEHSTRTLTAAMKWNRGFKMLRSEESHDDGEFEIISNGVYLDKSSIAGNLLFSGYLPQSITKNRLLHPNTGTRLENYKMSMTLIHRKDSLPDWYQKANLPKALLDMVESTNQVINLDFLSSPHIVYCKQPNKDTLERLGRFYVNEMDNDMMDGTKTFLPSYYWKEFVNEPLPSTMKLDQNLIPHYVKNAWRWYADVYPHDGHFEEFIFDDLSKAAQPFWNHDLSVFPNYPVNYTQPQIHVELDRKKFVTSDSNGRPRAEENYWLLPISNIYNTQLINDYTAAGGNPYTYEHQSSETWNWKMCGYTIKIDDILATQPKIVEYLEGDTYFQRYNCFKTVAKDTTFSTQWDNTENDAMPQDAANNVTETASVMIESYINLDGLYWTYSSTVSPDYSPLLHPYWNNHDQINPVYSIQNDICDVFKQIDMQYYSSALRHWPTMIMWSSQKHDGEDIDAWGVVPATNKYLVSGEMGSIQKLLSYGDNVFCLQDKGLSVLDWNAKVIEPTTTDSTISMILSDSTRLQNVTYLSRNSGTLDKWSVTIGQRGFYWVDNILKRFSGYMFIRNNEDGPAGGGKMGIADLSTSYGMVSWSDRNIFTENCVWSADTFVNGGRAYKASYDLKTGDVYWADGKHCICFNEALNCFTSFYDYQVTPWRFNWLDRSFSIQDIENTEIELPRCSSLWLDYSNYTHQLFHAEVHNYIQLLVNPRGQTDKVFNFVEYNAEAYNVDDPGRIITKFNPFTRIEVENMYQWGEGKIDKTNTQQKFRIFRTAVPREFDRVNNKHTMNRIRSPWCKIKLMHYATDGHPLLGSVVNEYSDRLYHINISYTIPEQPVRTNIRQ